MWDWIGALDEARKKVRPAVLVTVIRFRGSSPRKNDAKMLVFAKGDFLGTIGGGSLEKTAIEDAVECLKNGESKLFSYSLVKEKPSPCCGGSMEVYMEVMNQNPVLYLFGAGHVGQALCEVLSGTPFSVHLVDQRDEWINSDKVPKDVIRHQTEEESFIREATWNKDNSYVAIMTYNGDLDQKILSCALAKETRYIGMIGSLNKWEVVKKNLGLTEEDLKRIRCPLGHDNGGKSPKEIAVAVASELLSIHHGKQQF